MLLQEVEKKTGVAANNIYKYIKLGIIEPIQNIKHSPYEFSEDDVKIISLIKKSNKLELYKFLKIYMGKKFNYKNLKAIEDFAKK